VLGIFNACGYFGTFCGAMGAGFLIDHGGILWICLIVVVVAALWLIALFKMSNPHIFRNIYLNFQPNFSALLDDTRIVDIYALGDKFVIKYNSNLISEDEIHKKLKANNDKN
jgi:multidrug-efflux transporter